MLLWSDVVVKLGCDPLLIRRPFHAGRQPADFLLKAGLLIVRLQLDVFGFGLVLARDWHAARLSTELWHGAG
jgi:hypothetical protein